MIIEVEDETTIMMVVLIVERIVITRIIIREMINLVDPLSL